MVRVESIAYHLELVDTIAMWHWAEWGHSDPSGSLQMTSHPEYGMIAKL